MSSEKHALTSAEYIMEVPRYIKAFRASIPDFPEDPEIGHFLHSRTTFNTSAWGLFGAAFYDMAAEDLFSQRHALGPIEQNAQRNEVIVNAHRAFLLEDIVDARVDTLGLPIGERLDYLDRGFAVLMGKEDAVNIDPKKHDIRYRASLALAGLMHDQFLVKDEAGLVDPVFSEMVDAAKLQFECTNPEELLEICKTIGATCVDSTAVLVEIVGQRPLPRIRRAAAALGEYGLLLDHLYEIDDDLKEGSHTYPTAIIEIHGDTRKVRKQIKRRMLQEAQSAIERGIGELTPQQKPPYLFLKRMMDLKFRIIKGSRQHINAMKLLNSRQKTDSL